MTRHAPRSHDPSAYNALKTAWKGLVQRLGGIEATASCTRAVASRASEYGLVGGERFAPVDVILDAETVAGEPLVTAALARAQGYELIRTEAQGEGELARIQARIGRDVAGFFATCCEAIERGTITDAQRALLVEELDTLRRDCGLGIAQLRRLPTPEATPQPELPPPALAAVS